MAPSAPRTRRRAARARRANRTTPDAASTSVFPSVCGRRAFLQRGGRGGRLAGEGRLHVLREHDGDAEVVARHEAQLVERTRVLLPRQRAALHGVCAVALDVVVGLGASVGKREQLDGTEVAEGVARVHDAEVLLCKLSAVARVGVYRSEGVASKRVAVLERVGCRITNRSEELIERRVSPFFSAVDTTCQK